jgi:hypothetical protein
MICNPEAMIIIPDHAMQGIILVVLIIVLGAWIWMIRSGCGYDTLTGYYGLGPDFDDEDDVKIGGDHE